MVKVAMGVVPSLGAALLRAVAKPVPFHRRLGPAWCAYCMCSLRTPRVSSNLQSVRFMIYQAYQAHADALAPFRFMAGETLGLLASSQSAFVPDSAWSRNVMAACEIIASAGLTHKRPPFGIDSVTVGNRQVEVREESAARTPFCTLLHLKKDVEGAQPRVLLVAPMSRP